MAKYIVPKHVKKHPVLIKCYKCKSLYLPEMREKWGYYEKCPVCGCSTNSESDAIPLWRYNLIRYWRGLFDREQTDDCSTND